MINFFDGEGDAEPKEDEEEVRPTPSMPMESKDPVMHENPAE